MRTKVDSSTYPFEPRIDANDNENNNDTTSPTTSYFKIAAQVYNGFNYEINTYDNLLHYPSMALNYWTSSNVVAFPTGSGYAAPPYDHFSPSAAMVGPNSGGSDPDGTAYMVTHMTDDLTGNEAMLAEIIPYTNPTALMGGGYYWVSDDPAITTTADHLSASAPTCNKVDGAAIVAWYDNNGSIDDIKCRISGCCYAFKQDGQEPEIKSIPLTKGWRVYPNPAAGELTISSAGAKGGSYAITDVLGRTLLQGIISGSSAKANVSSLASGMYVVVIRGTNGENTVKKFVKD